MRPWQRLWLVLTILWAALLVLILPNVRQDFGMLSQVLLWVVGIPSVALYLILWAIAGFFPSREVA